MLGIRFLGIDMPWFRGLITQYHYCLDFYRTTKIVYKDLGKEIYQLEMSNKITVPKNWKKTSSTSVS